MQPTIKDEIEQLINKAKNLPNSESKNRMVSHLKDAHAHSVVLTIGVVARPKDFTVEERLDNTFTGCTCPAPGVISKSCPHHN